MKTVKEHNDAMRKVLVGYQNARPLAGVACDSCGHEMEFADNMTLTSCPPQRNVICPACKMRARIL